MNNFSVIHKLQRFVRFVKVLAFGGISHEIVNSTFFSFSCQRYLLSSVLLRLFSCLNDIWWFRHLALNSVFSLLVTVVWSISLPFRMPATQASKHSPFSGQSFL